MSSSDGPQCTHVCLKLINVPLLTSDSDVTLSACPSVSYSSYSEAAEVLDLPKRGLDSADDTASSYEGGGGSRNLAVGEYVRASDFLWPLCFNTSGDGTSFELRDGTLVGLEEWTR